MKTCWEIRGRIIYLPRINSQVLLLWNDSVSEFLLEHLQQSTKLFSSRFWKFLSESLTKTLQVLPPWKDNKWPSVAAHCPLTYINLIILSLRDRKRITCPDRKELCTLLGGFQLQSRGMNINENWNGDMEMETWAESDRCCLIVQMSRIRPRSAAGVERLHLCIFQYLHNRQENVGIISIKKCVCLFASNTE